MKNIILSVSMLVAASCAYAQTGSLTLQQCYQLAEQNYPLVKQRELITHSNQYTLESASKGWLPQVAIYGQATYQSDVTTLPLNMPGVEQLSKDQYKVYAELNQVIYDGGAIKQQKKLQEAASSIDQQTLEIQLYQLKERISQLFFGILLLDEQEKQNALVQKDIRLALNKTQAAIDNGSALKSSAALMKAEVLKTSQRSTELAATRKAYAEMLSLFINQPVDETTLLSKPEPVLSTKEIRRPELQLYANQQNAVNAREKLLLSRNYPRLNFFVQGGYGRPAFDILDDSFKSFYIGGLRLTIPLSGFYTLRNDKALLAISRQSSEVQKETFLFNTGLSIRQQSAETEKFSKLLSTDDEIISLRTAIKNTAAVQLENGIISSSDFLRELNAEDAAKQNRILHEIQLLSSQYQQNITTGN